MVKEMVAPSVRGGAVAGFGVEGRTAPALAIEGFSWDPNGVVLAGARN